MPAPIIAGLINYLTPLLAADQELADFSIWDGETPRFDTAGNAIGPSSTTGSWPAVVLTMQEPGFNRTHTIGTNSAKDVGTIIVRIWATTREQTEAMMEAVETAFEKQVDVYTNVELGGPTINPSYVFEMTLTIYGCWNDQNYRTSTSQFLYRGDMYWNCKVHSFVNTLT